TISGLIVLARAHVLITVRSSRPKAATFLASLKSTNGPFFSDRLILLLPLRVVARPYDMSSNVFTTTGTVSKCQLTPRGARSLTSTVTTTVTTTMRVICSIHNDTTDTWANTLTSVASS